jgi:hypothetical protein
MVGRNMPIKIDWGMIEAGCQNVFVDDRAQLAALERVDPFVAIFLADLRMHSGGGMPNVDRSISAKCSACSMPLANSNQNSTLPTLFDEFGQRGVIHVVLVDGSLQRVFVVIAGRRQPTSLMSSSVFGFFGKIGARYPSAIRRAKPGMSEMLYAMSVKILPFVSSQAQAIDRCG